jgi:outer membrane protein OmpA-like peptidoglycan-associated protein
MSDRHRKIFLLLAMLLGGGVCGHARAAPPMPIPHQVSQPVAPKTRYVVFFDFMKSDITPEATSILSAVAQTARDGGFRHAKIVGHADRVGSPDVNLALSEQRALSVKAELVKDGLDDASITTEGKGFSDPFVTTNPGVREPHNRRAVIELSP